MKTEKLKGVLHPNKGVKEPNRMYSYSSRGYKDVKNENKRYEAEEDLEKEFSFVNYYFQF